MSQFRVRITNVKRKSADVVVLPGVQRRDLAGEVVPSRRVLEAAIEMGVTDVVLVGRRRDGSQYVGGESNDVDHSVGVLMNAVHYIVSGTFAQGIEGTK